MRKTQLTAGLIGLAVMTVGGLGVMAQQRQNRTPADARMSGTYELQTSRGDDPQRVAEAATRLLPPGQRDRAYRNLLARLEPPQWLSIDRNGRAVTIASSLGPRSEFDADGRSQRERASDGRMSDTRAEIDGNRLRVSTSGGNRGSDFIVTFEPRNNGTELRVTRRLDDEDLRRPVTVESFYRRTQATPRWDVYGSDPGYAGGNDRRPGNGSSSGSRGVPDGIRIVATLDTPISMRTSRTGEPFTMTVRTPDEFRGARIDGMITRIDARRGTDEGSDMRVDFRSITERGRTMDFDAILNTVRLPDGTVLRMNDDGNVRDDDGNSTVRNGTIGAAVGAVIGAIAGGGKGAAVGAVVGGAGGVILSQDNERLEFPRGSEMSLASIERSQRRF